MIKEILAAASIVAAIAALFLGLNGSIDPVAMVVFSLAALALLYGFALRTVIVNSLDPQPQSIQREGIDASRRI